MSRNLILATALVAAAGAAGCVGSLEPNPGDDTTVDAPTTQASAGRTMFDRDVKPMLESNCASCHAGAVGSQPYKFLGVAGDTDDYDKVTGDPGINGGWQPSLASLLTQGAHEGPAFSDAEKAKITAWMTQEATDRNVDLSNPPPPPTNGPLSARQALAQWSACMQLQDWTDSQVFQWANKGTNNNGPCTTCHTNGAGAYYATGDANEMFTMNRQEIFIKTFFAVAPKNLADPSQGYEVVVNEAKLCAKGAGDGQSHPNYNCNGGNQMTYLRDFYTRTKARLASCTTPPGFPPPP